MSEWNTFFSAMTGAAATLTGLIFVGVSINLNKILSIPSLPDRGLESLILLLNILIVSAHSLVPAQSMQAVGIKFICIGGITWLILLYLDIRIWRNTPKQYKRHSRQNIVFSQLAILPYIFSGIMVLCEGAAGIYWIIPGITISFIKAIVDAWVLLVEIHR
jgi:modulator of FtsH protease